MEKSSEEPVPGGPLTGHAYIVAGNTLRFTRLHVWHDLLICPVALFCFGYHFHVCTVYCQVVAHTNRWYLCSRIVTSYLVPCGAATLCLYFLKPLTGGYFSRKLAYLYTYASSRQMSTVAS
ncbi:hypothetical protein TRVL_02059 [Trypanosoma vivax]|uniref:Uncharacterized protein n=1 Tax=Trypanosoma vivax (strain Y486) TaxID=1055687 RepID=G0U5V9_TRYVY|nr:hypothetical protein TRVL_02059 [Trypanosoma vivax]CCC51260.1 hypothetical protein TVY486_1003130 [Trypanosoma vivax Y486]